MFTHEAGTDCSFLFEIFETALDGNTAGISSILKRFTETRQEIGIRNKSGANTNDGFGNVYVLQKFRNLGENLKRFFFFCHMIGIGQQTDMRKTGSTYNIVPFSNCIQKITF